MMSTAAFILFGSLQVKTVDILVDVLLDNTFRKFYDFQVEKINGVGKIEKSEKSNEIFSGQMDKLITKAELEYTV